MGSEVLVRGDRRITLFCAFVTAFVVGLALAPKPSEAWTPPVAPVAPERASKLEPEIVVFVDVPLSVSSEVIAGVRAWERATRGWRRWRLGSITEAHMIISQIEPNVRCPVWASACAGALGGLERDENAWGRAWLVRGNYEAGARVITMHEIGHSLGLWHVEGTMMQSAPSVDMYLKVWRCPDGESLMRLQWQTGAVLNPAECSEP
jgi:hypothetical protein